jgi:hypothetical protein
MEKPKKQNVRIGFEIPVSPTSYQKLEKRAKKQKMTVDDYATKLILKHLESVS